MVGLSLLPALDVVLAPEVGDVFLEILPALRREVLLAVFGMRQDLLRPFHHVGAQVHHLAQLDAPPQAGRLGVGDRDAFVETVVGELFEVLRSDVVVERVPLVDAVREVPHPEVEVTEERDQADERQQAVAQQTVVARPPLPVQPDAPDQQRHRRQRQHHLEARALVVGEPLELVPGRLDDLRRGRVDDGHLGRERVRRRAIDLELGDRIGAVAQRLADAHEADRRRLDPDRARAQAVADVDDALDLGEQLVRRRRVLARAEHLVAVVGVGLQHERRHGAHDAEVVGERAGGRIQEHPGPRRIPLRPFGRCLAVGHQAKVAAGVLPRARHSVGDQVVGSALRRRHLRGGRAGRQKKHHGQDDGHQRPRQF